MRRAVVIAERNEWTHLQDTTTGGHSTPCGSYRVVHHRAVLAVDHEEGFFEFHIGNGIGPLGERIEPEVCQVLIALRMYDTRILVRRQLKVLSIQDERLLELGEEHETTHGWLGSGGEQTVIAPRVQAKNRGGHKAAKSVRFQPFAL